MGERTGVIVAGGQSTRMGDVDKTVVDVAGVPLVRRVANRLLAVVDHLVVNCRRDQQERLAAALAGLSPTFAVDEVPDRGPTAGIMTGLSAVETPYAAVVAADMPYLDPELLEYLFERADGHDAAVPRPEEWFEPLHAVYRPEPMAEACAEALEAADARIITPLSSLDHIVIERDAIVEHGSLRSFESVDTPEDLERARERLS